MASVWSQSRHGGSIWKNSSPASMARGMSWHTAGSLLMFTAFQVGGVLLLADTPGGRVLPFLALGVLMLVAVPFSRMIDRRWSRIADSALPSHGLATRYRHDRARLWRLAFIAPVMWIGLFSAAVRAATF